VWVQAQNHNFVRKSLFHFVFNTFKNEIFFYRIRLSIWRRITNLHNKRVTCFSNSRQYWQCNNSIYRLNPYLQHSLYYWHIHTHRLRTIIYFIFTLIDTFFPPPTLDEQFRDNIYSS
jgi:hypothetical protein